MDAKPKRLTVAPCPGGVTVTFTDQKLLDEASAWGWLRAEFEFFERLERARPRSRAWAA